MIFIILLFLFSLFLSGFEGAEEINTETDKYSLSVLIEGVEEAVHAELFPVKTEDYGSINFGKEDFDKGVLRTGFDVLEGDVLLTLTITD